MDVTHVLETNLLTPMPLFFALGMIATMIRSDLKIPEPLYIGLVLYLLGAIGLKGGAEIREAGLGAIWMPLLATLFLGMLIPCLAYLVLRKVGKLPTHDAAAVAGHYGSVSAVTFAVATQFLQSIHVYHEAYVSAFLAILEPTGVVIGILLARLSQVGEEAPVNNSRWLKTVLHEAVTGKGSLILLGALVIGFITGHRGVEMTAPFFVEPFKGVLCLFMLEMGLVAALRLKEVRAVGVFIVLFAIFMPILDGLLGVLAGEFVGLSLGGATMLGVMAASASYIAAPAAMRVSVPLANPSLYLTASLGVTFPFNIIAGIPLYFWLAHTLMGG